MMRRPATARRPVAPSRRCRRRRADSPARPIFSRRLPRTSPAFIARVGIRLSSSTMPLNTVPSLKSPGGNFSELTRFIQYNRGACARSRQQGINAYRLQLHFTDDEFQFPCS